MEKCKISIKMIHKTLMTCFLMVFLSSQAMAMSGQTSGYTATRYPIVLAHGLFGFDTALGLLVQGARNAGS